MLARPGTYELAVLTMLCGTVIFFLICPTAQGPYSVVNGPATTLASIRARLMLHLGIASAAVRLLGWDHLLRSFSTQCSSRCEVILSQPVPPEQIAVLRC